MNSELHYHPSAALNRIVRVSILRPSPLEKHRAGRARRGVDGDICLVAGGQPGPDFNYAVVLGPEPPERVFALASAFFADTGGYAVVVEAGAASETEAALQAGGWKLDEEEPALVLPALPASLPAGPDELEIRRVTDEAVFEDFFTVSRTRHRFVPSLAAAMDPDVALLVGYVEGRPVATSRLTCLGDLAEITGVVTLPEARRRGFGTAMTWAVIAEAARRGCAAITLTATELGYPVYVRMGFLPVCTLRTYLPPGTG